MKYSHKFSIRYFGERFAALAVFLGIAAFVRADVLVTSSGSEMEGTVTFDASKQLYTLTSATMTASFPASMVKEVRHESVAKSIAPTPETPQSAPTDPNAEALYQEGLALEQQSSAQALSEAVKKFKSAAAMGHINAACEAASILIPISQYARAEIINADPVTARNLFTRVAATGDVRGMVGMGLCCSYGWGFPQPDKAAAFFWFQKAAKLGSSPAMAMVGEAYFWGKGVPINAKASAEWLEKAADAGIDSSAMLLSQMYQAGEGVDKDEDRARSYLETAAKLGNDDAKHRLIWSQWQFTPDTIQQLETFKKATMDESQAQLNVARKPIPFNDPLERKEAADKILELERDLVSARMMQLDEVYLMMMYAYANSSLAESDEQNKVFQSIKNSDMADLVGDQFGSAWERQAGQITLANAKRHLNQLKVWQRVIYSVPAEQRKQAALEAIRIYFHDERSVDQIVSAPLDNGAEKFQLLNLGDFPTIQFNKSP